MAQKKIGIVGAGTIGKALFDHVKTSGIAQVSYVLVSGTHKAKDEDASLAAVLTQNIDQAMAHDVDLVVEAANPEVLAALAPRILAKANLCGFSISALANREVERAIEDAAARHGTRFFVPHGAIVGLDGLTDGRELIEQVVITTTKTGKSFGLDDKAEGVVFSGATREACALYPRNVNVHAAIALAGIGFDRTRSVVVANPTSQFMSHHVAVSGKNLKWEFSISSVSLGGVTGSYTPHSAVGSLRRILGLSAVANA